MSRCSLVMSVAVTCSLLSSCGGDAPEVSKARDVTWTAAQLQAFQTFKTNPAERAVVAESVARAFPAAIGDERIEAAHAGTGVPQSQLVQLLGEPHVTFSALERPEHLGGIDQQVNADPRELRVLLYDVSCLDPADAANEADLCTYLEAISVTQRVLRVRVVEDRRDAARKALTPAPPKPLRQEPGHFTSARPGWMRMERARAEEISKLLQTPTVDYEFFAFHTGDVVHGTVLKSWAATKVSSSLTVCVARLLDVFIPSVTHYVPHGEISTASDVSIAAFAAQGQTCEQRYAEGKFIFTRGPSLQPSQLARVDDLFARRAAAECDIPASWIPQGLVIATGGLYEIDVDATGAWSADGKLRFSPTRGKS